MRLRSSFPTLGTGLHLLDNAATAQMPSCVIAALAAHHACPRGNVRRGLHPAAEAADAAFDAARATVARFLSAEPGEVILTPGCTWSLNIAARAFAATLSPGDEILTTQLEHHASLLPWQAIATERGLVLKVLPVTPEGRLNLEALPGLLSARTRLAAVTLASNVTGAVTDLPALAAALHAAGALVIVDAAQAAPHGSLNPRALGADLLAFAGHKTYGPTGIGVLWGRAELLERLSPPIWGGGMVGDGLTPLPPPARFEPGTPPLSGTIGLAAALEWMMEQDWTAIGAHETALTARLLDGLTSLPGVTVIGPATTERRVPVVSFTLAGCHPHDVAQVLADRHIAVRAGHHCARPLAAALGLAEGTVRASLAPYTDAGDIDALLGGLDQARRVLG